MAETAEAMRMTENKRRPLSRQGYTPPFYEKQELKHKQWLKKWEEHNGFEGFDKAIYDSRLLGMTYKEIGKVFGLEGDSISRRYRKYCHKHRLTMIKKIQGYSIEEYNATRIKK